MSASETVKKILSKTQFDFIQSELGYGHDDINTLDEDGISSLYDDLCDIEIEETMTAGDGELSERGKMAEGIVTVMGNELYRLDEEEE